MSHEPTEFYWGPPVTQEEHDASRARGRNEHCEQVFRWYLAGRLPQPQLNEYLVDVWTGAEWPRGIAESLGMQDADIVRMMLHAGFLTDDPNATPPAEPMRLYRGCTEHGAEGFSWTDDPEKARWFATRGMFTDVEEYGEPCIVVATIPAEHILGMIVEGRGEREYIVNSIGARAAIEEAVYLDPDVPDIDAAADAALRRRVEMFA